MIVRTASCDLFSISSQLCMYGLMVSNSPQCCPCIAYICYMHAKNAKHKVCVAACADARANSPSCVRPIAQRLSGKLY